jgi:hypothetical protein
MRSIRANGFQQVRLETFPEGHNVKRPLTRAALRWFDSAHSVPTAVPSEKLMIGGSNLQMDAKEIGSGVQKQIAITVSDPSGKAGAIAVHVYFIGKAPIDGARFLYAHSDLSVSLRGTSNASAKVSVPALKSDPNRRAPYGYVLAGVGAMEGWIAIAQTNGKTFQVRASIPALLDVAQGKSQDSLNEMIADYENRTAQPKRRP